MRAISAIIFDLDGTLVNTLPDIADSMNRVLASHGQAAHPRERYRALIGGGIGAMVAQLVPEFDQARQSSVYNDFVVRYGNQLCRKSTRYPGMAAVVENLRAAGFALAVFSNKQHDLTRALVGHLFPPGSFKAIRGHVEGSGRKPDPELTRELLAELGAEPASTVLIGDTAIDAETAREVNMAFLGVAWGYRAAETLEEAGALAVFDRAEQIFDWMQRHNARDAIREGTFAQT